MVGLRHGAGAIIAAGVVVVMAGCGGGVSAGGTPSAAASSPSSSVDSAPATPSTSSAAPSPSSSGPGAPGVPAAARHHTRAGAIAFAKYYVKVVNEVGVKPEKGRLEPLSDPGCKTCKNFMNTVRENIKERTHFSNNQLVVSRYFAFYSKQRSKVWAVSKTPAADLLSDDGKVLDHYKAQPTVGLVYDLAWREVSGWTVKTIKYNTDITR